MKKMLFALMVLLLIGSGIAFVVLRPQLDQPATEGTINAKAQTSTVATAAQQPKASDGPASTVVPPTQNVKAAVPQLPEVDWIPESWPPAIDRINAALRQGAAAETIANPEKQRIRLEETTKELQSAISQFPVADSVDLYVPFFVQGFVSSTPKNRERDAFDAMMAGFAGGGNLSAFDKLSLQKIADRYGSFAICNFGCSKVPQTPSHKLLGSTPPAMEIIVVAGGGAESDLLERATFIKKELWMSGPIYKGFVFADSLDDGEFAKLELNQWFWLRAAFGKPDVITRIAPGQDFTSLMAGGGDRAIVTQVVGYAPRSMNSNAQRASRGLETNRQALDRIKQEKIARLASEEQDRIARDRVQKQREAEEAESRKLKAKADDRRNTIYHFSDKVLEAARQDSNGWATEARELVMQNAIQTVRASFGKSALYATGKGYLAQSNYKVLGVKAESPEPGNGISAFPTIPTVYLWRRALTRGLPDFTEYAQAVQQEGWAWGSHLPGPLICDCDRAPNSPFEGIVRTFMEYEGTRYNFDNSTGKERYLPERYHVKRVVADSTEVGIDQMGRLSNNVPQTSFSLQDKDFPTVTMSWPQLPPSLEAKIDAVIDGIINRSGWKK